MYKLYFGGYDEKHNQPLTFVEKSNKQLLVNNVHKLLDILKYGLDLYIEKPDHSIYSWYGDLSKYSEKEKWEILK